MVLQNASMMALRAWRRLRKIGFPLFLMFAVLGLAACYYPGSQRFAVQHLPSSAVTVITPVTPVYFYPQAGQTPGQQDRDRYECHNWAVSQTGFDPSVASLSPGQRMVVAPVPLPGFDTAVLGVGGAVLGALIGGPRHALGGALIGGATGVLAGAASDASRQESARQTEAAYNARYERNREAQWAGKTQEFRRAISACLEGRGYHVQ